MYTNVMNADILDFLKSHYPTLTKKQLEICRQVIIALMNLEDIREDIKNGYM